MTDDVMEINLDDLTIGEVIEIEEITGMAMDAMQDAAVPKGRMLQAMAYISRKRTDPDFTLEDALNLKLSVDGDEDPTDASVQDE
jgi:hypothetical protein